MLPPGEKNIIAVSGGYSMHACRITLFHKLRLFILLAIALNVTYAGNAEKELPIELQIRSWDTGKGVLKGLFVLYSPGQA